MASSQKVMSCRSTDISDYAIVLLVALAEAVACIVYVPVDVIKERLQVQGRESGEMKYKGGADALLKIWSREGVFGIYRGYAATLMSFGPFSALYFVFYERMKSISKNISASENLPLQWLVLSSSVAGALASFLTSPLDLAKLRLQVQRGQTSSGVTLTSYIGVLDCLQRTYLRSGVRGLFRGAGARVLHFVPATSKLICGKLALRRGGYLTQPFWVGVFVPAVTMTSYESMRQVFQKILFEES